MEARTILLPGWLLPVVLALTIWPRRAVAVVNDQVVVMSRNIWNGKHSVMGRLPASVLVPSDGGAGKVKVLLGPDVVTFRDNAFRRLRIAVSPPSAAPGTPWSPVLGATPPTKPYWPAASPAHIQTGPSVGRGVVLSLGAVLLVVGVVGVAVNSTGQADLAASTVLSPGPGLTATAIGTGGPVATKLLPGASQGVGSRSLEEVPTTPTVYLHGLTLTRLGVKSGTEAAYWKVWWNGTTQIKAAVCLQQHLDPASAARGVAALGVLGEDPAYLDDAVYSYSRSTYFAISGIPGAMGIAWFGTERRIPIEVMVGVFSRGSVVALVTMTAYRTTTDESEFLAFARAQYAAMPGGTQQFGAPEAGFCLLILAALTVIFLAARRKSVLVPGAPSAWQAPWPAVNPSPPPGPARPMWPGALPPQESAGPAPPRASLPDPPSRFETASSSAFVPAMTLRQLTLHAPPRVGEGTQSAPPGWYQDPLPTATAGVLRYWDGSVWVSVTANPV